MRFRALTGMKTNACLINPYVNLSECGESAYMTGVLFDRH